jgi:hypothetical protein
MGTITPADIQRKAEEISSNSYLQTPSEGHLIGPGKELAGLAELAGMTAREQKKRYRTLPLSTARRSYTCTSDRFQQSELRVVCRGIPFAVSLARSRCPMAWHSQPTTQSSASRNHKSGIPSDRLPGVPACRLSSRMYDMRQHVASKLSSDSLPRQSFITRTRRRLP